VNREYYQHTPLSLALIEEKGVRLNEVVKEEKRQDSRRLVKIPVWNCWNLVL
jgi:hypothetical protein